VPTAVLVTKPFVGQGHAMSKALGLANVRLVPVPHPLGELAPDDVRERARAAVPSLVAALLGSDLAV
jgi:hypothetical protein